jgi:predicted Zn-dependent protease
LERNSINKEKSEAVKEFARNIEFNNTKELNFTVINSKIINAFALPDGNIFIFTGLIDKLENYEELAALMGHEVSHVNNRHSIKMLCRNLAGYIFISAIFTDVNGIVSVIADNAHNLQNLSYSRKFENEADKHGTIILMQNKINPFGMISLFTRLQEEEHASSVIPEFLQTHDVTSARINNINNFIEENNYTEEYNPALNRLFEEIKAASITETDDKDKN